MVLCYLHQFYKTSSFDNVLSELTRMMLAPSDEDKKQNKKSAVATRELWHLIVVVVWFFGWLVDWFFVCLFLFLLFVSLLIQTTLFVTNEIWFPNLL